MKKARKSSIPVLIGWILGALGIGTLSTAYVDPGSGSLLIQILVASVLGAGLLIRAFWSQIKSLFGAKPRADAADTADTDDTD